MSQKGQRIIITDNNRYFLSGIYDSQIKETLDKFGEIAAPDAENPKRWLLISQQNGKLIAENDD
jgi:hypothetical protein